MNLLQKEDSKIRKYFSILEPDFPEWLDDYINTDVLLHQQYISVSCGIIYSNLFEYSFFYSSLEHSIAVALIVWHFTHDKKQTLAGLFHDISTPVFKHCVDFLADDYMEQESTEDLTTEFIRSSKKIMNLLKRDNIELSEINDYHIYPIADNKTPKLSSDRLEYSLSNALFIYHLASEKEIYEIYNDIEVQKNEDGIEELGFKTKKIAEKFVKISSRLSVLYREDRTRYSMQFLADIIKKLNEDGKIFKKDLYSLKESEIIEIIKNSKYAKEFDIWKNAKKVKTAKVEPKDVYYVHHGAKVRYIVPLVKGKRIDQISTTAKRYISKNLSYDMSKYVYLDFMY